MGELETRERPRVRHESQARVGFREKPQQVEMTARRSYHCESDACALYGTVEGGYNLRRNGWASWK